MIAVRSSASSRGFTRIAPFLLVVAIILADVIKVSECRNIQEDQLHHKVLRKRSFEPEIDQNGFLEQPQADGAAESEDDGTNNNAPVIQSVSSTIEATEGSTVQLPCTVAQGSLDDFTLIWINGTKTIMTDGEPAIPDPRISVSKSAPLAKTLIIDGVSRWDSGKYTCRITSELPVEITHTLRVLHPIKIVSLKAVGAFETSSGGPMKKFTMKQGDSVQLICKVDGNPEPKVKWTKMTNSQQILPTIMSNTNELRIENTVATRDAGVYECEAQSQQGTDPQTVKSEMELIIEYPPEVVLREPVVHTGEDYTAQLICSVNAYPKVKITWEKEQIDIDGSFVQLSTDNPNGRFNTFHPKDTLQSLHNGNTMTAGHKYGLKVKSVQRMDFGRYRCKAENKLGHAYSDIITLTGTPATPQKLFVSSKDSYPIVGWTVDSWSPLLDYQLQIKRQQDRPSLWLDVRPEPQVVDPNSAIKDVDQRRYNVSYVFGENIQLQQSAGVSDYKKLDLPSGTTFMCRIRARNQHGWSDWSADLVFAGVENDWSNSKSGNDASDATDLSKASIGGSGTSGGISHMQQLRYCGVIMAIVLAVASYC